jgi:hypothetical protein
MFTIAVSLTLRRWGSAASASRSRCRRLYILRGANWARGFAVAWIVYHAVLSAFHSVADLVIHAALSVIVAYVLFVRPHRPILQV